MILLQNPRNLSVFPLDRGLFITLKSGFAKDFSFAKLYKDYPNLTAGFTCFKTKKEEKIQYKWWSILVGAYLG